MRSTLVTTMAMSLEPSLCSPTTRSVESTQVPLIFMMTVSFTIAFAFTAMGFWVVLPFTALEMAVLGYCCCGFAKTLEYPGSFISHPETITLEVGIKRPQKTYRWQRFFTKIQVQPAFTLGTARKYRLFTKVPSWKLDDFLTPMNKRSCWHFCAH